ncbi:MAG: phosphoglycolate phosphatase [Nitrososphaeria archaeon]
MIKLLAVDVDGTLTEKDGKLNLEAVSLLRKLQENGLNVILATGRSVFETYTLSRFLGLANFGISENGGVVFHKEPTRVKIFGRYEDSLKAFNYLSERIEGVKINQRMPRLTEILLERNFDITAANELLRSGGINAKILDSGVMYHLSSTEVNKGAALKYIMYKLQLKKEEVASIGDSEVDVPMFCESGYSFLVNDKFSVGDEVRSLTKLITTKRQGPMGVIESVEWLMVNDLIPY